MSDGPDDLPTSVEEGKDAAQETPNGVLVTKIVDADGRLSTSLQVLGDVQITEAQFLLELGIKEFRQALGLGQAGR